VVADFEASETVAVRSVPLEWDTGTVFHGFRNQTKSDVIMLPKLGHNLISQEYFV
jgi:hypothetical protein